ncbi:transglutaminase domain-containing protein [Thiospirochaeta perfilievii]|uniref:Transglutaminase domain-containing protein n=1 Tax=Thiospirochaeta perfilievii TaxID=252967 RepID=A0A5C1QCV1_9SPIO|nr:transglutaminase-like domain-containing protein [Thiospirochaeta perfilievii]QEN04789.1 transglutaminase domain-containing protein [Thiospirochaeta perfilievii]
MYRKIILLLISIIIPQILNFYILKQNYDSFLLLFSIVVFTLYNLIQSRKVIFILTILFYLFFIIRLIIIPFSFYIAWFNSDTFVIPNSTITDILKYLLTYIWVYYLGVFTKKITINFILQLLLLILLFTSLIVKYSWIILLIFILLIVIFNLNIVIYKEKYVTIIVSTLLILIISFISYKGSKTEGSIFLNKTSYQVRKVLNKYFPTINLLTTIPGLDNYFSSYSGRPPILGKQPLFTVVGNPGDRYYLRFKIDSNKNSKMDVKHSKSNSGSIKIEVLSDFLPIIPTTLDTTTVNGKIVNNLNNTLEPDKPLLKGEIIYIKRGTPSVVNEIYEAKEFNSSNKINELSNSLKGKNDLETINNIRYYLLENYSYSLETEESINYIEKFILETKKGFCIHFTRSFILLASLNNIISREVSGYVVDIPINDYNTSYQVYGGNKAIVTGEDAHLWPEVYLENRWITFEVTPSVFKEKNL